MSKNDLDQKLSALDKSLADLRSFMAATAAGTSAAASAQGGNDAPAAPVRPYTPAPRPTGVTPPLAPAPSAYTPSTTYTPRQEDRSVRSTAFTPTAPSPFATPSSAGGPLSNTAASNAALSASMIAPTESQLIRVAKVVESTTGIMLTGRLYDKLANALAKIGATPHVEQWIVGYEMLADKHPSHLDMVEQLTVHETYFYRDERQLEYVRQVLMPQMIRAQIAAGHDTLRIWSAACSTGEEAYTLAIIAVDVLATLAADSTIAHRVSSMRVEVLGTDISRVALAKAEGALYRTEGLGSFRDAPAYILDHFQNIPRREGTRIINELRVLPSIRQMVRFQHFNLLSGTPPGREFDFVFCRNVLIYMNDANRLQVFRMLNRALAPHGNILFGPTDSLKGAEIFTLHQVGGQSYYTRS